MGKRGLAGGLLAVVLGAAVVAYWSRASRPPPAEGSTDEPVRAGAAAPTFAIGGTESDAIATALRAQAPAGARPTIAAIRADLATGQTRDVPLALSAGRCVELVAAGGAGVAEVDLDVADTAGTRVASETQHAAVETVHFCAPSTGTYRLTVRTAAGAGPVGIQAFEDATP